MTKNMIKNMQEYDQENWLVITITGLSYHAEET